MDLDFSEEQRLLRETLRGLCGEHVDGARLRAWERDPAGFGGAFWAALAGLGITGLRIPEVFGGSGLGLVEAAIVQEELGRCLAPSPLAPSAFFAARLVQLAGDAAQQQAWLPDMAAGREIVVPAWQESGRSPEIRALGLPAERAGARIRVSGSKTLVPFAASAQALLVPVRLEGDLRLLRVPAGSPGLACTPLPNHAAQPLARVDLQAVTLPAVILLTSGDAIGAWDRAADEALVAAAAESVGGAARMLELATAYARERVQFGQPIGAFQSIAHGLADLATAVEGARWLVYQAAWAADAGKPFARLARMAKLRAGAVFREASWKGVQIHGGLGFSLDADPQLYYRRAKHQQLMGWEPAWLEEQIAQAVFD